MAKNYLAENRSQIDKRKPSVSLEAPSMMQKLIVSMNVITK